MSEMTERVRKALREAEAEWDRVAHTDAYFPTAHGHHDHMGLALARAAIEAMREPTDAMISASSEEGVGWGDDNARGYVKAEWQAMLDAALADDKQPV